MFLIIGSIVVLLSVGIGFVGGGGSLLLLWHPLEVLIICGAALGAFLISNPPKVVKASVSGIMALLKPPKYSRADYVDLFKLLYDILVKARKEGMLAIESHIDDPHASSLFSQYSSDSAGTLNAVAHVSPTPTLPGPALGHGKNVRIVPGDPTSSPK